ncbi:C4-type zinc finger DksA/TraR family protein [Mizugakiibacter sediminis]|uniref:C4-type zinc finger DksA/TraR family protein n=1 Tax=Mizugakiibacter sediminis TaxID=1475481 RepID=A0A0K8QN02_9GAMM|nr:TraR/DksA C4-type zinc finger protein [Mizugakiibacter sediminis]GAP66280.1 C4-type zinc finger DksA/TraR family protein [Mizugakiibacter sediminis]
MADVIDQANDLADSERSALVRLQVARGQQPRVPPQHATDGRRICIDCGEPISHQRLAAVPNAVACTDCEAAAEHRDRHHRRRSPWAP